MRGSVHGRVGSYGHRLRSGRPRPAMKRLLVLLPLALAIASGASATTVVVGTDEALFDQAALIVEGTVAGSRPARSGAAAIEYELQVERALKGKAPAPELVVRVPGGRGDDGRTLVIWGAPRFSAGERVLLFLGRYPDGAFGPLHLALGAFHEVSGTDRTLAVRDLSEVEDLSSPPAREPTRELERFAGWLADRAAGRRRAPDYLVEEAGPARLPSHGKFTYLGGFKQRWIEFGQGQSVGWRAQKSGQPGVGGGGFTQFQAAIAAWNNDAATDIRYTYDGTTSKKGGLQTFDTVNAILFDDPNAEVIGTFSCSSPGNGSGVLALGGTWIETSDPQPIRIQGGDIVTNDGAGCWFSTGKRAEQVFGHELGHTLGLGHSCGDITSGPCSDPVKADALMRATAYPDERGARLNADDRAGILSLYPDNAGKPPAPSLLAAAVAGTTVQLTWKDNSTSETGFRIERSSPATGWALLATVPAGSTSHSTTVELDTPYSFRVRANGPTRNSDFSNVASLTVPAGPPAPCAAGATSLCLLGGRFRVEVRWRTGSDNGAGTAVPNSDQTGLFWFFDAANVELIVKMFDARPLTPTFWAFAGGLSDVEYWIVVTDTQTAATRTYHNEADNLCGFGDIAAFPAPASPAGSMVAPAADDGAAALRPVAAASCAPGTLCLFGGRFQVEVSWKADGTEGSGTPVPFAGTDLSGMFWFFSASNIELVVKVIDARSLNGKIWFFYGALSDVEYDITVADTTDETTRTYHNAPGNLCGKGDVNAFE